ncbi:MAG: hypothetical protein ACE145_10030 [Terriglobia bacterium]
MRKQIGRRMLGVVFAASLLCAFEGAYAQEGQPKPEVEDVKVVAAPKPAQTMPVSVYRFEYVIRELEDGKQINSRHYMLSARGRQLARLRVGSQVPAPTGQQGQIQYQGVGINIDSRLGEEGNGFLLYTAFESSSVVLGPGATVAGAPVIRQVRTEGDSLVTLGKPTVIATLDDVATNRRYEIEVTVTKVK